MKKTYVVAFALLLTAMLLLASTALAVGCADGEHNWGICQFCGAKVDVGTHYGENENSTECLNCGAPMKPHGYIEQAEDGNFYYYGPDGKVDTTFCSPAEGFEGGLFFVMNGKIDLSVNGVVYMKGPAFYFYANGQVQRVTQLAEYNGNWFLLSDGKVNEAYTGLYNYNGGTFLITNGQLRSDYTGPWTDPTLGEIQVVNGQVQ